MRLDCGTADLLARRRPSTEPQQRNQFHLEALADGVDPARRRCRELSRRDVQVAELGAETHRVLGLVQQTFSKLCGPSNWDNASTACGD